MRRHRPAASGAERRIKLTRRGWLAALTGIAALGAGRVFGISEATLSGVGLLGFIALCAAWTWSRPMSLQIERTVTPTRVVVGGMSQIELKLRADRRTAPLFSLVDPISSVSGAQFVVGPLRRGDEAWLRYRLPVRHRGRITVGPALARLADPMGFSEVAVRADSACEVIAYPVTVPLNAAALERGSESGGARDDAVDRRQIGEDFSGLRDFVDGDDIRRIHWPSTARLGHPMVREDQAPRRSRVVVLLDTRSTVFDDDRFELAVGAAGSVILAVTQHRESIRLLTLVGTDTGFVPPGEATAQLFDHLADVQRSSNGSLRAMLHAAADAPGTRAVAIIGASGPDARADMRALAQARPCFASLTVIGVPAPSTADAQPSAPMGAFDNAFDAFDIGSLEELTLRWSAARSDRHAA